MTLPTNIEIRPEPGQMKPYEFIYWRLMDMGNIDLAQGVRLLIAGREFYREDCEFLKERIKQLEAKLSGTEGE